MAVPQTNNANDITTTMTFDNATLRIAGDNDSVTITGSNDTVCITGSSDTLTLNGGNDTLAFGTPDHGDYVINGFNTFDVLQFNLALFADASAAFGAANTSGSDTVIQYDTKGDTITVVGVTLTQSNFRVS